MSSRRRGLRRICYDRPTNSPVRLRLAAFAAAAFAVLLWGATPVVTKAAAHALDPVLVGLLRTVLAGGVALPIALGLRLPAPRSARQRALLALSAFSGFVAFPLLFTLGQGNTSATHGALILASVPVFTGLYAMALDRRLPAPRWWLGCAIALGGEVFLIAFRGRFEDRGATVLGDGAVLAAGLVVGLGYVAGARLAQTGYGTWATTFWGVTVAAVLLTPVVPLAARSTGWSQASALGWAGVAYLALGSTILAYVAWYWALGAGGIARMGLLQFFQPVIGIVLAALVLGEPVTAKEVASAVAILAGVFVAQRA